MRWLLLLRDFIWTRLQGRMTPALYFSGSLLALLVMFRPALLSTTLYKLVLITSAAWLAYWLDRWLFPYARPDAFLDDAWGLGAPPQAKDYPIDPLRMQAFVWSMARRALIVSAAMIAVAWGA